VRAASRDPTSQSELSVDVSMQSVVVVEVDHGRLDGIAVPGSGHLVDHRA
jgi:hypothetical protein